MNLRLATPDDLPLLGELNRQLIEDEGLLVPLPAPQLEEQLRRQLAEGCRAALFEEGAEVVAYALYREEGERLWLRHLFVRRDRRRRGIGRACVRQLRAELWPREKRVTVEVLCGNLAALAFYHSLGFADFFTTLELFQ